MPKGKLKVLGLLLLILAVTITMSACDMLDDEEGDAAEDTYSLEIDYEGMGQTTPPPGEHDFAEHSIVDLEAVPYDADWEFAYWEGDVSDRQEEETIIFMDEDKEVEAIFVERDDVSYELTIAYEGQGNVEPSMGTHEYEANELVEVEATPAEGWEFDYWRGDVMESEQNIAYIYMDADSEVEAVFSRE